MSRLKRKYCLISTSYLTGRVRWHFHITSRLTALCVFLVTFYQWGHCDAYHKEFESHLIAFNPGHIWINLRTLCMLNKRSTHSQQFDFFPELRTGRSNNRLSSIALVSILWSYPKDPGIGVSRKLRPQTKDPQNSDPLIYKKKNDLNSSKFL